jgi:hypothetical protein
LDKNLSIPISILLGCALIGAGLFFGLRERPVAAPPTPAAAEATEEPDAPPRPAPSAPSAPAAPPATQAALPIPAGFALGPPAAPKAIQEAATKDATAALEALRKKLVKACWAPAVAKEPTPARSKYLYQMTFDPSGKEIARGISETRDESRPDVARCLREQPMGLTIPPPGAVVAVDVTLHLP